MTTSSYIRLGNCVDQWYCPQCKSINNSGVYEIPTQLDSPSIRNTQPQTDPNHLNISTALSSIPSEVSTPRSKNSTENETRNSSSLSEAPQNADSMFLTSSPKPNVPSYNRKQSNNLRILNINFRSAKKKGKDLEAIIDTCNPDIIIGTETWLNPQIKSAEIISPQLGFDVYRRDRTDSYGGVMIAAKQELQLCDIEVSKSVELVHGNIKTREGKRMTLVAYYRPPNRTDDQYLQDTSNEFQRLKHKSGRGILMIAGDFNLPDINWQTLSIKSHHYSEKVNKTFLDIIANNDLEQQVDFPTRKDHNTLDLVLTTHPSFKVRCKPLPSIGNSDHDIVLYDTALVPQHPKPTRTIYLWKKADIPGMKQDVMDFNNTYHRPDPTTPNALQQMWIAIRDLLSDIVKKRVPTKTTAARYSNPWINTSIRRAIRRKQRAHQKARKTGKKKDKDRYKRLQAETRYEIRQAYHNYLEEISQDFKTNSKRFWSFVKSRRQDSTGVAPLKDKSASLKATVRVKRRSLAISSSLSLQKKTPPVYQTKEQVPSLTCRP